MDGPRIETDRLILRPPEEADLDGYAAMMADEPAARFVGGLQDRAGSWRILAIVAGSWALHGYGMFSVVEKETGRWIGRLGPWVPEGWPGPEIAYGFDRSAWGKGYAAEGVAAAIDWAFDTLGWNDVIHCIDPANSASRRVAERLGARVRGQAFLPPPFHKVPMDIWGQTKAEWRSRERSGA